MTKLLVLLLLVGAVLGLAVYVDNDTQVVVKPTPISVVPEVTTIAFLADFGDPTGPAEKVSLKIREWNPEWVVTGGDNNYPNGALEDFDTHTKAHFEQWINSQHFLPALGNHDWWKGFPANSTLSYTPEELPSCHYFFYLSPCRYYQKQLSPHVEVFIYDSDRREPDGVGIESKQAMWLKNALANSNSKWQIVVLHEPPASSCRHGGNHLVAELPLKEWGADVLLAGHCHNYERLDWNGLPLVINGAGGGGGLYGFESIHPKSLKRYQGYGYVAIEAFQDQMRITFRSIDNSFTDELIVQ